VLAVAQAENRPSSRRVYGHRLYAVLRPVCAGSCPSTPASRPRFPWNQTVRLRRAGRKRGFHMPANSVHRGPAFGIDDGDLVWLLNGTWLPSIRRAPLLQTVQSSRLTTDPCQQGLAQALLAMLVLGCGAGVARPEATFVARLTQ